MEKALKLALFLIVLPSKFLFAQYCEKRMIVKPFEIINSPKNIMYFGQSITSKVKNVLTSINIEVTNNENPADVIEDFQNNGSNIKNAPNNNLIYVTGKVECLDFEHIELIITFTDEYNNSKTLPISFSPAEFINSTKREEKISGNLIMTLDCSYKDIKIDDITNKRSSDLNQIEINKKLLADLHIENSKAYRNNEVDNLKKHGAALTELERKNSSLNTTVIGYDEQIAKYNEGKRRNALNVQNNTFTPKSVQTTQLAKPHTIINCGCTNETNQGGVAYKKIIDIQKFKEFYQNNFEFVQLLVVDSEYSKMIGWDKINKVKSANGGEIYLLNGQFFLNGPFGKSEISTKKATANKYVPNTTIFNF